MIRFYYFIFYAAGDFYVKKVFSFIWNLLSSIASAQSEKFEGAYYGIGYVAGSTNTKGTDTTTSLYDNNGQSMQVWSVEVGYG